MILGFKKQFVFPILEGKKIHTIREDKLDRWKSGKHIHFATGVRTKEYHQFVEGTCKSTQKIKVRIRRVSIADHLSVFIDDKELSYDEIVKLVSNDGFGNIFDFIDWFKRDFEGKIIHWTDFRY